MDLKRQIAASHGIQKVKTNGELRAKTAVNPFSQKLMRTIHYQVDSWYFYGYATICKIQAIFLGYSVETPREILLLRIQSEILLHPVTAPYAGIKIRFHSERLCADLF